MMKMLIGERIQKQKGNKKYLLGKGYKNRKVIRIQLYFIQRCVFKLISRTMPQHKKEWGVLHVTTTAVKIF
jgi:hypothetical protein